MKNPFRRRQKQYLANDGQWYTEQQYQEAANMVLQHLKEQGKRVVSLCHFHITGAIWGQTDDGSPSFQYYMRDLTRGIIRESGDAYDDYQEAVLIAGIVPRGPR